MLTEIDACIQMSDKSAANPVNLSFARSFTLCRLVVVV